MSYLMGEGTSSALVRHPSSDDVIIKMSYGVDLLLNQSALHPTFPTRLDKTESDFLVRSVETGLQR